MSTRTVQLGEVCEFIRGVTFDKIEATTTPEIGKIPILRAGNIGEDLDAQNDLVWVPESIVSQEQLLRRNDIAICMSSGSPEVVGKTARVPTNLHASVGSFCGIIRPKNADQSAYLSFFFRSLAFYKHRDAIARGANIQNLRFSQFQEIDLIVPAEQKQTAARLEQADQLRRTRRYALELSDTFLPATFLELFGDPIRNEKEWSQVALGEHLEFLTSGSRGWASYYSDSGDLFLRIQNVGRGSLLLDDLTYVRAPTSAEAERTRVRAGDVLLSITADLGRSAWIPENFPTAYINQHLAILRARDFAPVFLASTLSSVPARHKWDAIDRDAVKSGLNFNDIRGFKLIAPPHALQQKFAAIVERYESLRANQREALHQADHLFQALLHYAFSGEGLSDRGSEFRLVAQLSPHEVISRRAAVACYIVCRLHPSPTFGRTQLMKSLYMAETHTGIDLQGEYERQTAGPFDESIYRLEKEAQKQHWFDVQKKQTRKGHPQIRYLPLPNLTGKVSEAEVILGDKRQELDRVLALFEQRTTEEIEIITTLYAAWNDELLKKGSPSDDQIIREVLENWHEAKKRFARSGLQSWLKWMKENRFVPKGTGPQTRLNEAGQKG